MEQLIGIDLPEWYEIEPRDLFSKWGFAEGDMFANAVQWLRCVEGIRVDPKELLGLVIREVVHSWLDPAPRLGWVKTAGNPIRAITRQRRLALESETSDPWPDVVRVPSDEVLDLARSLGEAVDDIGYSADAMWQDLDAA